MSQLGRVNDKRRAPESMEPINIALPADIVLELDRMVEIGVVPNRAAAARLLMRKGMEK